MAGGKRYKDNYQSRNKRILYDARGVRVKGSILTNSYVRILLFNILPYLVINGIILCLVCASPGITIDVSDTDDYVTAQVDFTVNSLLPIKEMTVSLESEELEYEKSGKNYKATATNNGTFMVRATSINGMQKTVFADVATLDDTAPTVDEASAAVSGGKLTFTIYDSQSGVDYDSIYAIVDDSETIYPEETDRDLGLVTMALPSNASTINLNFADMVGNARACSITVNVVTEYIDPEEESTEEDGAGEETEEA